METIVNKYPVLVRPLDQDEGGGFLAEVPDLPGCMADGETQEGALRNIEGAIAEWTVAAERLGQPMPVPSA